MTAFQRAVLLLAEHEVLYELLAARLASLERRIPVAGLTLAAFLGAATVAPVAAGAYLLLSLPVALVWYLRTTVAHARSFEDLVRRIDEIEGHVNRLVGEELLAFQSRHPSKGRAVGGRTGTETVLTAYVLGVLAYNTFVLSRFLRYRYEKQPSAAAAATGAHRPKGI